ncbi:MAG TPA: Rieske 2Fe-2S domain-containing protein [Candidatus Binatia bacterium]|nr:Rieske 2Fe-2S domain-containing protein [Candidatus Binatia bacterium]
MAEFVRVAAAGDIPKGEGRTFELNGKKIAVFNCGGAYYAIDDACKHQGGPLGEGELDGTVVTCPWHGWTYDVTSGESPDDPGCSVERYEVKVDGDAVLVGV